MKDALFFVAFLLAATTVSSKTINYDKCTAPDTTPENGEITKIDVTPCDEDPCVLKKGGNTTVTINFTPHEHFENAKIFAWAFLGGLPEPLPVPSPDACNGHGLSCPVASGAEVQLVYTVFITDDIPSGSLKLDAGLNAQHGFEGSLICGKVSLTIA
ncbi:NPC intracellular cholesterol transporter 2-like [Oculina patagonica]